MHEQTQAALRRLPKVDEVLKGEAVQALLAEAPRWAVLRAVREEIDGLRQALLAGAAADAMCSAEPHAVDGERVRAAVRRLTRPALRPVINATGVILHTNLGRAPLPAAALSRIAEVAGGYSNLEYRLTQGERGSRHEHLDALLAPLTGAQAHLVVNNNAAALLLMLAGLCEGRQVVVSRGELVEIGGSFRIPDVMRASAAQLCEVGTTNRTHLRDYEGAVGPRTAAFLKVHQSNFAIVGFTAAVEVAELAAAAHRLGLLCLCDLGSGALCDLSDIGAGGAGGAAGAGGSASSIGPVGLPAEPTVAQVIDSGCDLVCFSGDKLLGGPQAGVLCGRSELIAQLHKHPLMRALRPDKLTLLALSATLELYRDSPGGLPLSQVPVLRMLAESEPALLSRAEAVAAACLSRGVPVSVRSVQSAVGGGSLPLGRQRSFAVALHRSAAPPDQMEQALRKGERPVVCRIAEDHLLLDLRTVAAAEQPALCAALCSAYAQVVRQP